jgi:hypothetical protein
LNRVLALHATVGQKSCRFRNLMVFRARDRRRRASSRFDAVLMTQAISPRCKTL